MNTLLQLFEDPAIARVFTQSERADITIACVRYIFKLSTLKEFKDQLAEFGLPTELWRAAVNNSSMASRVKLWLRYLSKYPNKKSAKRFGVDPCNVELRDIMLADTELMNEIASIPGPTLTWSKMQKVLANAILDLTPHVKNRVYKKMRFLVNDSGNDLEDFEGELMVYVISGLYAKYPRFDNYAHLLNTGRTVANNMSINLIKHHTSQGRNTKYQNADGTFSSNKVSLDALTENKTTGEYLGDEYLSTDSATYELELQLSLGAIVDSPKKQRALKILLGYDMKFSKWLVSTNKTTIVENNKFQDRLIAKGRNKEYLNHVAEYLEIPLIKLEYFLNNICSGLCLDAKALRL